MIWSLLLQIDDWALLALPPLLLLHLLSFFTVITRQEAAATTTAKPRPFLAWSSNFSIRLNAWIMMFCDQRPFLLHER